ncbi:MAG TPA: hypothetical protein VKU60_08580, partial [Chloroflexota bacterium]|nr:hypothetical protein [Chloroflexota bacterium]
MFQRLRLLMQLPGYCLLSWRLFRDPRVPPQPKVLAVLAVVFILSPLDLLDWLPAIGGVGELALLAVVLRAFISAAPEDVRAEHMAELGIRL